MKEESYHRIERMYGSFQRSFSLPVSVDQEKVTAKFKDGVLEVSYLDAVQHYERREPPFYRFDRYALSVQGLVETQSVLTELPAIP